MKKSVKSIKEEEVLRDFMRVLNLVRAANLALVDASEELPFLQNFCKILVDHGGYPLVWVGYAEPNGSKRIIPVASWGDEDHYLESVTFTWDEEELGRAPIGAAVRTGQPCLSQDLETDPDFAPWREETLAREFASCLALPLIGPEQILGALTLFSDKPEAFRETEVDLLSRLAETMAYGVMVLRTRAESRILKERLAWKAQMLDFAGESIFVQDLSGRFITVNQATYRDLGYTEKELRQLNRFQLEPPEFAKLQDKRLEELLEKGEAAYESAHFCKDSSVMPLKIHSRVFESNGEKLILSAAQNINELRQASQALKEAEERYRTILDRAQLGVFQLRLSDGKMMESTPRLAQIFGYADQDEFVKEFILTEQFVDPGTREKLFAGFKNVDLKKFEARCHRKDGTVVWILLSARLDAAQGYIDGVVTDISDLKRAEEELQKSEDKYRVLVEQQLGRSLLYAMERHRLKQEVNREKQLSEKLIKNSDDGILAFDRNLQLNLWNTGMETMTGLSKKKVIGKSLFKVLPIFKEVHDAHQIFGAAPAQNILDNYKPLRLSPLSPEGYFDGSFWPLHSESGEVIGGLVVIHNITELRKLEGDLGDKERLLTNLFGSLQDGIVIMDKEFNILRTNQVMEQWYAHEQPLAGRKCFEALQAEMHPCENCPTRHTLETGEMCHEVKPRKGPGGETVGWLEVYAYPLIDQETGNCVGIIERAVDITERHQQEATLKEAEERYHLLIDNIPIVVATAYADGAVDFFDDKIGHLTGYPKEEFDTRRLKWKDLVAEEDLENLEATVAQAARNDRSYAIEYRISTKEGRTLWVQESSQIICTEDGSIDHINMIVFDITERKRTEEITPKLEAQLRQAQRMEAIGTLAGGIAHDFNNILGVMLGYAEMALYSLTEDNDLKRKLQQILKAGQRGKDLVSQILAFSRPTKPERKPIQVGTIIKETLKMLRATLPTTVELRINLEKEKDSVLGDPTQIHQVLVNLCANAAHAMREKGGILDVSLTAVDLDQAVAAQYHVLSPGPYVKLTLKDTGHGMEKDVVERIFDPFFTTKAPGEGTGMGLAVVHGIVKAHGGVITVQSELGKGTEFQVLLPRINGTPTPGTKERTRMDKGQGYILFVDDEEGLVEMWQEILENMGYEVEPYTKSLDALEAFRTDSQKYDLVITDQTMAHMTGFELAKKMLEIRTDVPIILCTGYSELVSPEKAKEAGIKEYVMKPLSISELTGAIQRALGTETVIIKG